MLQDEWAPKSFGGTEVYLNEPSSSDDYHPHYQMDRSYTCEVGSLPASVPLRIREVAPRSIWEKLGRTRTNLSPVVEDEDFLRSNFIPPRFGTTCLTNCCLADR